MLSYRHSFHAGNHADVLKHIVLMLILENLSLKDANISANIITKIRTGKYIALDKLESICLALNCTPNDVLEFIKEEK